jgi:putative FmdB family regulatory protein
MPFYDYRCDSCSHVVHDVRRNITADVSVYVCPNCQSEMKQIYSLLGFELKGDGWFKDGYSYSNKEKKDAKEKENRTTD